MTECPVCFSSVKKFFELPVCGHRFCHSCINQWFSMEKKDCPCCRGTVAEETVTWALFDELPDHVNMEDEGDEEASDE